MKNNCCKTGESRESVNSDKMPQNGLGGISLLLFTVLGILKYSKFCLSLCYFMLHASRPIIKICSNTVFCITSSAMLVIWHYLYKLQCQILVHLSHFSVRIRLTYGDQFGNRSQTLKNCCKTSQSRESVNSVKMPQNAPK